jgi:actin-related protein 5
LDYLFIKLGVDGANGGVDRPIVMTEPIANPNYPRKSGKTACEIEAGADV